MKDLSGGSEFNRRNRPKRVRFHPALTPRTSRGGQPSYSALAIATALTLRTVFRLALHQTEGMIGSLLQLRGLNVRVPDHSTLSRRAETLEVPRPRAGSAPIHLLVDNTGLKLCGPGEWLIREAWHQAVSSAGIWVFGECQIALTCVKK